MVVAMGALFVFTQLLPLNTLITANAGTRTRAAPYAKPGFQERIGEKALIRKHGGGEVSTSAGTVS